MGRPDTDAPLYNNDGGGAKVKSLKDMESGLLNAKKLVERGVTVSSASDILTGSFEGYADLAAKIAKMKGASNERALTGLGGKIKGIATKLSRSIQSLSGAVIYVYTIAEKNAITNFNNNITSITEAKDVSGNTIVKFTHSKFKALIEGTAAGPLQKAITKTYKEYNGNQASILKTLVGHQKNMGRDSLYGLTAEERRLVTWASRDANYESVKKSLTDL